MIEETDTRVRDATGGHPKVRAPASIFWTVSQSQAQPTSAGHMRTAILIPGSGPKGPIQSFGANPPYWLRVSITPNRATEDGVHEF